MFLWQEWPPLELKSSSRHILLTNFMGLISFFHPWKQKNIRKPEAWKTPVTWNGWRNFKKLRHKICRSNFNCSAEQQQPPNATPFSGVRWQTCFWGRHLFFERSDFYVRSCIPFKTNEIYKKSLQHFPLPYLKFFSVLLIQLENAVSVLLCAALLLSYYRLIYNLSVLSIKSTEEYMQLAC